MHTDLPPRRHVHRRLRDPRRYQEVRSPPLCVRVSANSLYNISASKIPDNTQKCAQRSPLPVSVGNTRISR